MNGKIALEEHWEPTDVDVTGEHVFTKPDYFDDVERRLKEVDERVSDMDNTGIEISILSLTQPGIELVQTAARLNQPAGAPPSQPRQDDGSAMFPVRIGQVASGTRHGRCPAPWPHRGGQAQEYALA